MKALHETFDHIADQLSESGYSIVEGFVGKDDYGPLREKLIHWNEEGDLKRAGIGSAHQFTKDKSIRGDLIRWVNDENPIPEVRHYLARIRNLMDFLNRTCYLGLKDFEMHYTTYPPGTFYKRHSDRFQGTSYRVISAVLYLNQDWEKIQGGELVLYPDAAEPVTVEPRGGTLALFRSEIEHEVLPTTVNRYSVTGWLLNRPASLTFIK